MNEVKQLLSKIARKHLLILTLESRHSDSLDFYDVSVWAVEAALRAAYDAGRQAAEPDAIDIHAQLAQRKQVAAIWSIEDVQQVRPDLTDDQAWQVLLAVERQHDAELGINWQTLECVAEDLCGDAPEASEQ